MTAAALWFVSIVFFIIIGFIFVLGYSRYKELKAVENKINKTHNDVRDMQQQYRRALQGLSDKQLISSQQRQSINKLITNFFVFQPINDVNFSHFRQLFETLMTEIRAINELNIAEQHYTSIALHELAANLPVNNGDYTTRFYLDMAPTFAEQLAQRTRDLKEEAAQQTPNSENNNEINELEAGSGEFQHETQINERAG